MKRRDLIKKLIIAGYIQVRHGAEHDVYRGSDGKQVTVPRHKELNELTANRILKDAGLK